MKPSRPSNLPLCVFVALALGAAVSLAAITQAEVQATRSARAQDHTQQTPLNDAIRQCNQARQRGNWADAKKVCPFVLELADQLPDSFEKARALYQVVPFLDRTEDGTQQSIALLHRIFDMDKQVLEPDDPQLTLDLHALATHYDFVHKPAEAEEFYKREIALADNAQQMNCFFRVLAFTNAAEFYRKQKRYSEAEGLMRRGLQLASGLPPRQRGMFVNIRASLSDILRAEGKPAEADQLLAEPVPPAPVSNRKVATPDWTATLNDFTQGQEFKNQGRLREAELHFRLTISALERVPASSRPLFFAEALDQLAELSHSQHRDGEAEELFLRALHFREQFVSEQDPKINPNLAIVLSTPWALQNFYRDQGRLNEIEPVYKRAIQIQETQYGPTDLSVSATLVFLASVYQEEKKFDDAVALYARALKIKEEKLGADDPQLAPILGDYANALQELGRTDEANKFRARETQLSIRRRASE